MFFQQGTPHSLHQTRIFEVKYKGKGKAVPSQAWSGSECSRKLMFPEFLTMVQDVGQVVSLTLRPHLYH
jgi:hypothetical protein